MNRLTALAIGGAASLAATFLWHGPLGAGQRVAALVDRQVRTMLDHYEMSQVTVAMQRAPLTRRVLLGGPADDFQRREIKRMSETLPGVAVASWNGPRGRFQLPLLVEAMLMALVVFAAGVILAYVAALRRRSREEIEG